MTQIQDMLASNRRVLIVEDDRRMREMLERAVVSMEFQPYLSSSAEEALTRVTRDDIGIVIADLNLPGMHGLEFCSQLRARCPDIQIIVLTGFGDLNAAQRAIRLEVADFLTKPCPLGQLEVALARALKRRLDRQTESRPLVDLHAPDEARPPTSLRDLERQRILEALARHNGNRLAAANELGISVRTLYYRLRDYQRQGHF